MLDLMTTWLTISGHISSCTIGMVNGHLVGAQVVDKVITIENDL